MYSGTFFKDWKKRTVKGKNLHSAKIASRVKGKSKHSQMKEN